MPPRSYLIIAAMLGVLVVVSLPPTLGFSIILWFWLFEALGCILAIAGVFKIVGGLRAPLWIGIALALPGFVWVANRLYEMPTVLPHLGIVYAFNLAAYIALLTAALGALRLVEIMSRPDAAFRAAYGVLAVSALLVAVGGSAYATGWTIRKNEVYATSAELVSIAAAFVEYGAFIGAAALITARRNIESWTGAAIGLVSAYMLYKTISSMFVINRDGLMFWLQPVVMLVGGAAVWRMGSLLRRQALPELSLQS